MNKKFLKSILLIIISYLGLFLVNNIRNLFNLLIYNINNITYISFPFIISLIIFMFYIFKIRKKLKNKYFDASFLIILGLFNIRNVWLIKIN